MSALLQIVLLGGVALFVLGMLYALFRVMQTLKWK
mgnify:CR=1 FL=1